MVCCVCLEFVVVRMVCVVLNYFFVVMVVRVVFVRGRELIEVLVVLEWGNNLL